MLSSRPLEPEGGGPHIPTGFPDTGLEPIHWIPGCQQTFQRESRKVHFCSLSLQPLIYNSETVSCCMYSGIVTQSLRAHLTVTLGTLYMFCSLHSD